MFTCNIVYYKNKLFIFFLEFPDGIFWIKLFLAYHRTFKIFLTNTGE